MKIKQQTIAVALLLIATLMSGACGTGVVDVDDSNYEPRIVIQGYLYPGSKPDDIRILRNFALNTDFKREELALPQARVQLRHEQTGTTYDLSYDANRRTFTYSGTDLVIGYTETWSLFVEATIDGQALSANATTTTPAQGFRIDREASELEPLRFRERGAFGLIKSFNITFDRSPGTEFYALSMVALNADTNAVVDWGPVSDLSNEEVAEQMDEYRFSYTWLQNLPTTAGRSNMEILWFLLSFYGEYRGILYAGDRNFKDFFLTQGNVQEIDGNFHEPIFHINGDGIGVFGSAIADTVNFEILRETLPTMTTSSGRAWIH